MGFSKKDMKEFERISKLDMLIRSGIILVFHISQHSISGFSTTDNKYISVDPKENVPI